jgi:hypothetical protein
MAVAKTRNVYDAVVMSQLATLNYKVMPGSSSPIVLKL